MFTEGHKMHTTRDFGPDAVTAELDEQMASKHEPSPVQQYVIANPGAVTDTTLCVYARWDGDDVEITQVDIYPDAACEMRPLVDGLELSDFTEQGRADVIVAVYRAERLRRAAKVRAALEGALA